MSPCFICLSLLECAHREPAVALAYLDAEFHWRKKLASIEPLRQTGKARKIQAIERKPHGTATTRTTTKPLARAAKSAG